MGKAIATNKKAYRDYFLTDAFECGIELKGGEVKSIRDGHVSFNGTFARIHKMEVIIFNLHIEPYLQASYLNDDPVRDRKLLLHKKEIQKLESKLVQSGQTLIPTKIYFNNRGMVKVELAFGKGKKLYDKREDKKKSTIKRDIGRVIKNKNAR